MFWIANCLSDFPSVTRNHDLADFPIALLDTLFCVVITKNSKSCVDEKKSFEFPHNVIDKGNKPLNELSYMRYDTTAPIVVLMGYTIIVGWYLDDIATEHTCNL